MAGFEVLILFSLSFFFQIFLMLAVSLAKMARLIASLHRRASQM
jgi:hypothetical protein